MPNKNKKQNNNVPSALPARNNFTFFDNAKNNLQLFWEKAKGNPFIEQFIPLEDLSNGKTEAIIPYIALTSVGGGAINNGRAFFKHLKNNTKLLSSAERRIKEANKRVNMYIKNRGKLDFTSKSNLSLRESKGLPKGTKAYTLEENIAFRNQINEFAKKYGYEPIGDEVTDPEVLERYARSLIKRHNTFYKGVKASDDTTAALYATTSPGGGAGELYITPYQKYASLYGDPVEILRPYKLGADRTKWFVEGDFNIATAGGNREMNAFDGVSGIVDPWSSNRNLVQSNVNKIVPTELTGRNQQFIPMRVSHKPKYGSKDWVNSSEWFQSVGSKNTPSVPFYPNTQFKNGGNKLINNMLEPNIIRGGNSIPIGYNLFLMKGRTHKYGGIDVGKGLEVENNEVVQTSPEEIRVFSAQKFLGGKSPAELILSGANPNKVFAAQETYKRINGINDDGTKAKFGKLKSAAKAVLNFFGLGNKNNSDNNSSTVDETIQENNKQSEKPINKRKGSIYLSNGKLKEYADYNYSDDDTPLLKITKEYRQKINEKIKQASRPLPYDKRYLDSTEIKIPYDDKAIAKYLPGTTYTVGALSQIYDVAKNLNMSPNRLAAIMMLESGNHKVDYTTYGHSHDYYDKLIADEIGWGKFNPISPNKEDSTIMKNLGIWKNGLSDEENLIKAKTIYDSLYNKIDSILTNDNSQVGVDRIARMHKKYGDLNPGQKGFNGTKTTWLESVDAGEEYLKKLGIFNEFFKIPTKEKQYGGDMKNNIIKVNLFNVPSTGKQKMAGGGREVTYADKNGVLHSYNPNDDAYKNGVKPNDYDEQQTNMYYGQKKIKQNHWLTTGLASGLNALSGIIGASVNNATNRKYLSAMETLMRGIKAYNAPIYKLKTDYDINPQLAEIEQGLGQYVKDVNANTASSNSALNRLRAARLAGIVEKNKLYSTKENEETELINADILNQQQQIAANVKNAQDIHNTKQQLLASLFDKRAENATATTENIIGAINSGAQSLINGVNSYEQLLAGLAKDPDGAKYIYGKAGEGIIGSIIKRKTKRK